MNFIVWRYSMGEETLIPLNEAYRIGRCMARGWMIATIILSAITISLICLIASSETVAETLVDAKDIVAEMLKSSTIIKD